MADTIPDLWPNAALKPTVLSPVAVLRAQAALVAKKTQGLLIAEVTTTAGVDQRVELGLELVAPALSNYRYRLLKVQHERNAAYPAEVFAKVFEAKALAQIEPVRVGVSAERPNYLSKKLVASKTAYSDTDFINIIKEVLQDPETIALLQTFIMRSNDEAIDATAPADTKTEE